MSLALSLRWRSPTFIFLKMLPALLRGTNVFLKTINVLRQSMSKDDLQGLPQRPITQAFQ